MYTNFLTEDLKNAFFFRITMFSFVVYFAFPSDPPLSVFFLSAVENMQFFHNTLDRNLYHDFHCMHNFTTV